MPTTVFGKHSTVLICDDDEDVLKLIAGALRQEGYVTILAPSGEELKARITPDVQVVVLDLRLPGISGLECLEHITSHFPDTQVIMVTGSGDVTTAVKAIKAGAFEYMVKPLRLDELVIIVEKAVGLYKLKVENRRLRQNVGEPRPQSFFLGESAVIRELMERAERIAHLDSTVLITGETGTGKGLLARYIHFSSRRADHPFITVNCTALPRDLVESELFGHQRGAFTGAVEQRLGRFELASGGTLLLDEVGDMPIEIQPKLLNALQDQRIQRVGGTKDIPVNVRVIAATNRDLKHMIQRGLFREDLFYRLNVIPMHVPPLREHIEDIGQLAENYLGIIASRSRLAEPPRLSPEALETLKQYTWPGNVRELENVLEQAAIFCRGPVIAPDVLTRDIFKAPSIPVGKPSWSPNGGDLAGRTLDEVERMAIEQTLSQCRGNKTRAAQVLGITKKSIYNKMKRLGIKPQ